MSEPLIEEFEGVAVVDRVLLADGDQVCLLRYEVGGPKTQDNLVRLTRDGRLVWRAEPPDASAGDRWVSVEGDQTGWLAANSWSCWRVTLDPATGRDLSKYFTK
jgi:hypothetical protein